MISTNEYLKLPLEEYYLENEKIIHHMVRKVGLTPNDHLYDDIFQLGAETFIKCYKGFKGCYGVKFSTFFARAFINNYHLHGSNYKTAINIPRVYRQVWRYADDQGNFDMEFLKEKFPDLKEKTIEECIHQYEFRASSISLHTPIKNADGSTLEISGFFGKDDDYSLMEFNDLLTGCNLTDHEKEIVKMKADGYNQSEIAKIKGVKQPTISRQFTKIENKLNSKMKKVV